MRDSYAGRGGAHWHGFGLQMKGRCKYFAPSYSMGAVHIYLDIQLMDNNVAIVYPMQINPSTSVPMKRSEQPVPGHHIKGKKACLIDFISLIACRGV